MKYAFTVIAVVLVSASCDEIAPNARDAAWRTPTGAEYGDFASGNTPATDGARFFATHRLGVDAFDAQTGTRLWRTEGLRGAELTTLLLAKSGRLYAAGDRVAALDATAGAVLWSFRPDSTASLTDNAADDEMVFAGDYGRNVYALDGATGTLRWRTNVTGADWMPVRFNPLRGLAVSGDTVYASAERKYSVNGFYSAAVVVALDRRSGRELWRHQHGGATSRNGVGGFVVVSGSMLVYADIRAGAYVGLRRSDGAELWRVTTGATFAGPSRAPAVVGGVVYGGTPDTYVYAIEAITGRVLWKNNPVGGSIYHTAVCGSAVYANWLGLMVLERRSGRFLGKSFHEGDDMARSGFAVAGSRIFFLTTRHAVALNCAP